MATLITSNVENTKRFPLTIEDGGTKLKRYKVEGVLYATSKADAESLIEDSSLAAAKISLK